MSENPHKYHQKGNRLVQVGRDGHWHGYIGYLYRTSFDNEAEALAWLERKEP